MLIKGDHWKTVTSLFIGIILFLVGLVWALFSISAEKVSEVKFEEILKVNFNEHSDLKDDVHILDKKVEVYATKQEMIIQAVDKVDKKLDKVLEEL